MSEEKKECSFFRKVLISIKDFEKYPDLASKKWGVVLVYLMKLLAIFTVVVSFCSIYAVSKEIKSGLAYIESEVPNFVFEDNKLKVEGESPIVKEDNKNFFDFVVLDTGNLEEETVKGYKDSLQNADNGVVLLQDKALLKTKVTNGMLEYSYESIANEYQIENFNKNEMLNYFSGNNLLLIYFGIFIMIFIYLFLMYFTSIWLDIILLALFGYIVAFFMGMRLRFVAMCKIAIHSLTLPILLNTIVVLIESFTTFRIKYFEVMYIGIAYVYVLAAILMIKSDVMKNKQELIKIIEEQQKVREELERQKEEEQQRKEEQRREKEKEKKRKKEKKEENEGNNVGKEPQGENA